MGNRTVGQHTVPRMYLQNFADDGALSVIKRNGNSYLNSIKKASVRNNFYDMSLEGLPPDFIEGAMLADLVENPTAPLLKEIWERRNRWPLEDKNRTTILAFYLTIQYLRGADKRSHPGYIDDSIFSAYKQFEFGEISQYTFHEIVDRINDPNEPIDPNHHMHNILNAEYFFPSFYERAWGLVRFEEQALITCDAPVVMGNVSGIDIEINNSLVTQEDDVCPDHAPMILFPLGRRVGLIMVRKPETDPEELSKGFHDFIIPPTLELSNVFNLSMLRNAHEEVYTHPEDKDMAISLIGQYFH